MLPLLLLHIRLDLGLNRPRSPIGVLIRGSHQLVFPSLHDPQAERCAGIRTRLSFHSRVRAFSRLNSLHRSVLHQNSAHIIFHSRASYSHCQLPVIQQSTNGRDCVKVVLPLYLRINKQASLLFHHVRPEAIRPASQIPVVTSRLASNPVVEVPLHSCNF